MSGTNQDALHEAIKRARELAAKLPKLSAKRTASELDDVTSIKVSLAYTKTPPQNSAKDNHNDQPNQEGPDATCTRSSLATPPLTGANAYMRAGDEKIEIIIPHSVIGLVIGKGGENIKRIQTQTGATVRVDPNTIDEQGNKVCTITGTRQAVTDAHIQVTQVIESAATGKRPRVQVEDGESYRMKIPAARTGAIIGKGGETIKQIKQTSGCEIELDKGSKDASPDESVFIIRGTPDKIAKARQLIESRLSTRGRDGDKDKAAAWGAYFAQYSSRFNPAGAGPQASPVQFTQPDQTQDVNPTSLLTGPTQLAAANQQLPQIQQPQQDYTDQWIEYYIAVGRPDYAEQTIQMKKQQQQLLQQQQQQQQQQHHS